MKYALCLKKLRGPLFRPDSHTNQYVFLFLCNSQVQMGIQYLAQTEVTMSVYSFKVLTKAKIEERGGAVG